MTPSNKVKFFTFRISPALSRALRVYSVSNDETMQSIGEEMIQVWAKAKGIQLPPAPPSMPENSGDQARAS